MLDKAGEEGKGLPETEIGFGGMKHLIEFDKEDLYVVRYSLCLGLRNTQQDLSILQITKERELTRSEMCMLNSRLIGMDRQELCEEIDSWISLRDHYVDLIQKIEKMLGE